MFGPFKGCQLLFKKQLLTEQMIRIQVIWGYHSYESKSFINCRQMHMHYSTLPKVSFLYSFLKNAIYNKCSIQIGQFCCKNEKNYTQKFYDRKAKLIDNYLTISCIYPDIHGREQPLQTNNQQVNMWMLR